MTQSPNPQPSQPQYTGIGLEDVRRLLDSKLVNTGLPGVIAGFAISRAFEGNWQQFFYLLSAAGGVWLVIKLSSKIAPKVEVAIDQADQAFDRQVDRTLSTLTGFHRQYLEALQHRCYSLQVEGAKSYVPRLVLEDIYVPLRLNSASQRYQVSGRSLSQIPTIWEFLPHRDDESLPYRLLAIVADPGYGKTTLMRFLTLRFANRSAEEKGAKPFIPVLLLFREIHSRIESETLPKLPKLIVEQVQKLPRCESLRASEPWFDDQLQQGKCLIMLDGLDEVPEAQRTLVSQWANWQMQNYPSQFILTSRPHGYDSDRFEDVRQLDILDFNNDQKQTFIDQWYDFICWDYWYREYEKSQRQPDESKRLSIEQAKETSQEEARKAAADLSRQLFADQNLVKLAKNPLLLTIIVATHEAYDSLPGKRIQVYQRIFRLLLEDRPNKRETRLPLAIVEENQDVLQKIALALVEQGITQFTPKQGVEWIGNCLAQYRKPDELSPRDYLKKVQEVSGLLAGEEGNLYEFTHKTFQEYLAALELKDSPDGQARVMAQITNENWEEVVYFYGMLTDPIPLITVMAGNVLDEITQQTNQSETATYTLGLAQRLANDHPRVSEALKKRLLELRQRQQPESAEVRLAQRFQHLTPFSETTAISDAITWGEYQLFLCDQTEKQFHSWAEERRIAPEENNQPVTQIRWEDAQWFCAWLATQPNLAPNEGVYDYRLPTLEELMQYVKVYNSQNPKSKIQNIKFPISSAGPIESLQVVRQRIPDRYGNLVNYLANGRWKEADQETDKVMLQAVGEEAVKRRYLELEEIRNFPCEDLCIIDQLWVKFSGGKFGFSVQKDLWVEVGGKLDFGEDQETARQAYKKMSDRNGWQVENQYIKHDEAIFDTSAPSAHLPIGWVGGSGWGRGLGADLLLSHPNL